MSNFVLFGVLSLGSIGLVGMLVGFQSSTTWWVSIGFVLGIIGYSIFLLSDTGEITIKYKSPNKDKVEG